MRAWLPRPDVVRAGALAVTIWAGLTACSGDSDRQSIDTLPRVRAVLGETAELCLLMAATSAQRSTGLQAVPELPDDVDGMAFVYPSPVTGRFHMANTLIPLDIAFVDDAGDVVDVVAMAPCAHEPCPTYGASGPYVLAIETVAGTVPWNRSGGRVTLEGACR